MPPAAATEAHPIAHEALPDTPSRKAFRISWAALLARVWDVDVLRCPLCGGERRILAGITNLVAARRILTHLGLQQLPRPPDVHDCEDRDPALQVRHPLLHAEQPAIDTEVVKERDVAPQELTTELPEYDLVDPDPGWPVDAPFQDD